MHVAIDEDHCYAFKPGRVKAEYWPEYDLYNTAATTFTATQEEEDNTYTALKGSPPQDLGSEEAIQAIQACPVIMEEDLHYQEPDYTKETVKAGTEYLKEFVIEQEQQVNLEQGQVQEQEEEEEVEQKEAPEYTTIVYQDKVGAEQFYTETIVTDVMATEEYYNGGNNVSYGGNGGNNPAVQQVAAEVEKPAVRIKNKRTVAAVSNEDKRRALNAMEELRARGATTDDLMCRLCDPARPFTAYSTLLTHYRSHAGLRPFECSLCGATFTRQHSLNYHLMTHANQTRFTCPHCNRKFRHPTHFKEHVKKHGEVVQFLCNFCPASLSTQSQYRKHLKMRHNKTIDIMGNIIDSLPEAKDKDRAKRKRRVVKPEEETTGLSKRKRRRRLKTDSTEISQYEEVVHSSSNQNQNSGSVIYEETVPMSESEQMYQTSEYLEPKEGLEMFDPHQGQYVEQVALQYTESEPQYVEQYVVATNDHEAKVQAGEREVKQHQQQHQPKSPMIFVVPNSGQKPQVNRKPLLINTAGEQKKQVVISKVQQQQSNLGKVGEGRMKQGVIAQINGQKVLLVPKKKGDGSGADQHRVLVMSQASAQVSTGAQQQQMTWNGQQQSTLALALSTQSGGVQQQRVVSQQVRSKSSGLQSTVRLASSTGVVAVTTRVYPDAKQSCLTEIDPNTVQKSTTDNVVADANKINILEQAMHEVFPSDIDFAEGSPEEASADIQQATQVVDDLYNPMRSPLKNRNKILCEVLGIDS